MSQPSEITYGARWIFPVDAPPLERGSITVSGARIVAVEPHGTRRADVDLGHMAILPGFVNTHTHLDLTGARGQCPPTPDFTQWLRQVIAFRRSRSAEQVRADIGMGLAECLRLGTTLIGDISADGTSWTALSDADCRAVVFRELLGLTADRAASSVQDACKWLGQLPRPSCVAGLSPHAPYSVRRTLYDEFRFKMSPMTTHLAETAAELELLRSHRGPFVDFLQELGVWNPDGLVSDVRDVMDALPRGIFVHGNYLDPATPFLPTQTVVVCPRSHAAFGHPAHPFPHFLQRGVRVALGTDSLASNPDLDILAEARFLRRHYPAVAPAILLRMLTLSGAEALGFDGVAGSLTAGKSADLVVLPLPDEAKTDPHDLILETDLAVHAVMFRGECKEGVLPAA